MLPVSRRTRIRRKHLGSRVAAYWDFVQRMIHLSIQSSTRVENTWNLAPLWYNGRHMQLLNVLLNVIREGPAVYKVKLVTFITVYFSIYPWNTSWNINQWRGCGGKALRGPNNGPCPFYSTHNTEDSHNNRVETTRGSSRAHKSVPTICPLK